MECLPDADTVGNEDEIGSTCFNLMWMDCVRGDEELCLPGQGDEPQRCTEADACPPKGCYTSDQTRGGWGGTRVQWSAVIRLVRAAAHPLFLL